MFVSKHSNKLDQSIFSPHASLQCYHSNCRQQSHTTACQNCPCPLVFVHNSNVEFSVSIQCLISRQEFFLLPALMCRNSVLPSVEFYWGIACISFPNFQWHCLAVMVMVFIYRIFYMIYSNAVYMSKGEIGHQHI